jgi:peptidoglycan hydrolase FlgJ
MTPIAPLAPETTLKPALPDQRKDLAAAAKAFEAIFVRQMLAAARKTDFGDSTFDSQAMQTFRQMQDERFAEIASERGSLGLARIIEARLARFVDPPAPAPAQKEQ